MDVEKVYDDLVDIEANSKEDELLNRIMSIKYYDDFDFSIEEIEALEEKMDREETFLNISNNFRNTVDKTKTMETKTPFI